ncbi:MAG: hypothetical protein IPG07_12035 [Crocinitomicaceae bacterium]|nr:hypothetical protein [Crocinitomicaceae bacterium]
MKRYLVMTILSFSATLISCKKEGCTDPQAFNYNADANENDGTCTYQSRTSFWFNQTTSNWLSVTNGITSLNIYLNEVLAGTMDPTDWKVGPDCGGDNFTITNNHGGTPTKSWAYEVRDQNGTLQYSGSITNSANDCTNVQLHQ